ncbi:MAG TPA: hypothetical protein VGY54_20985, partial [Polyangiaceae bacterium]|nr:hypothetical protein [Polyangiaceae bacterium]
QGPPRSQPETRVPLRPDAIDRTVRATDRAPPPLSTETSSAERARRRACDSLRAGAPAAVPTAGR